jgi:prepilin-type N-terminal cleavage/methylation domain-containing protein
VESPDWEGPGKLAFKERKYSGFTLIELLVVIAIIAILAAMLFPVVARAKDMAKDTATLTQVRQVGAATIMYAGDSDDALPLIFQEDKPALGFNTWQTSVQPYAKSWGVFVHPKLRAEDSEAQWQRLQFFGGLPKVETVRIKSNGYSANLGPYTQFHTGLLTGLFGSVSRGSYGYERGSFPSLTLSQINEQGKTLMFSEAGNWDMLMGTFRMDRPLSFCSRDGTWGAGKSPYAGQYVFAGPHARKLPRDNKTGVGSTCEYPDGYTTYVAPDGSAKTVDFRSKILERAMLPDGREVFVRFWPDGLGY